MESGEGAFLRDLDGRRFLDLNGNGVFDAGEPSTTTDSNGAYSFGPLAGGTYQVRINPATLPAGSLASFDADGIGSLHVATVAVAINQNVTGINFGYYQLGSISGTVFADTTGDNLGDTPQVGVILALRGVQNRPR